ncbi:glycosyltransferase [Alicyclobacillus ferrooxydans]|uniref:Uncharacterized protein n=1 Tax=Alicyclobacillus ferrooxydans TaxID=471514 RepID=A0A0N8PNT0_9BACL|nr:glycosyltransferase [Alicyclobacillus ferrooxydans]KPV42381.1 hypothetical protein AN477_17355 [Alicyclobacillus ferrooxydans]
MQVVWEGNWHSPNGHATVCRNMVRALTKRGIDVRLDSPIQEDAGQPTDFADQDLRIMANRSAAQPEDTIRIIHRVPTDFVRGRDRLTIGMTYTEATSMPQEWVDAVNSQVDALILPSQQAAQVAMNAGVVRPVWVVPQGVDVHAFRPRQPGEPDPFDWPHFRFLSVFEWVPRKGYDVLLNAFWDEFSNRDDVCLVIKTRYFGQGSVPGGAASALDELQYSYRVYQQTHGEGIGTTPGKQRVQSAGRKRSNATGKRPGGKAVKTAGKARGRKRPDEVSKAIGRTGQRKAGKAVGRAVRGKAGKPIGRLGQGMVGKAVGHLGQGMAGKAVGRLGQGMVAITRLGKAGKSVGRIGRGVKRAGVKRAGIQNHVLKHTGVSPSEIHYGPRLPLETFVRFAPDDKAPIYLYEGMLAEVKLAELYRFCSTFVLPTHGEGIGLPLLEAAATGLPLVVTGWGGQMDFIRAEDAYTIDYTIGEVPLQMQSTWPSLRGGTWANPRLDSLRSQMRNLYELRFEVSPRAVRQQQHVITKWNWDACTSHLIAHLEGALGEEL